MEECFTKVAPEQFLFAVTAVLIIMLLKYRISAGPKARKYPFWFGLLAGFGLATKMTFLPMLLIPFIVLTGNRNKWLYVMAIIPAFVLFTIPAISGYPHMVYWFLNLGSHTGTYGQGSQGIIDPAMYIHSLMDIVKNNKAMVAVLAMGSLVLFFRFLNTRNQKRSGPGKVFMMLMAVLIAQFASILMVAKHYHNNHYLFPALSLTGFVLLLLYMLIRENAEGKGLNLLKYSSPFVVAVVIGFSLLNIPYLSLAYKGYRMSNQSTDAAVDRLSRDYKDYVKVYYYPTSFNVYSSLRWGNVYSRQYSNDKLMELFPEGLFYNVWDKTFQWWETNITTRDFVRKYGGKILLVGGPLTNEEFIKTEQSGLKLRKLFDSRVQAVFEIDTAQSPMFKGIARNSPAKFSVQTDFETISTDGQWMMSDNGAAFCKNSDIMTDKSRSGKHAIRLPDLDSYGMKYDLQDVKPGNSYELSIWQLGGGQNVFMVASAENPDQFYVQSKGYVETDSKGWRKMILDFDIPQGFKGNKLKVYLWNHGRSIVWFDDFLITGY